MRFGLAVACLLLGMATAEAKPTLPHIISDHMMLQRHRPIAIWGWAEPGEQITVSLGTKKQETHALANRVWLVEFPPLDAGGPLALTVAGQGTIVVRDVLVGEVWVASGQSNMEYALSRSQGGDLAVAKATNPEIRLFKVPQASSLEPRDDVAAGWRVCSPEAAADFSAVAYYFARDLQAALDVPLGIVQTTWSGTSAELWIDEASLAREPDFRPILDRWDSAPASDKAIARASVEFRLEIDDVEVLADSPTTLSSFDDGKARTSTGGHWTATDSSGCALELVSPGRGGTGAALAYSGRIGTADTLATRVDFDRDGAPVDMSRYSGVRFQARGKGFYRVHFSEPSITDWDDYAAPVFELTDAWQTITVRFEDLKQSGWGVQLPFTPRELTGFSIDVMKGPGEWTEMAPSSLYNAMVAPLTKYGIRGALWYQGEGNAGRAFQYRKLLPMLIRSWRAAWNEGEIPFLVVQLPNFGEGPNEATQSAWAEMREAQLLTKLKMPGVGLAVTIDLGEPGNVHPQRKAEVGGRLALWALGTAYGRAGEFSGPLFRSSEVQGHAIRIRFDHAGSGLAARGGGRLEGFVIAGADRKFKKADAVVEGDTIVVSSPEVPSAVAVRYAWAGNPACNLVNGASLPASPFRTDDWPGVTVGEK